MPSASPTRRILVTLLANGIGVENVEPVADGYVLSCSSRDRFGAELRYVVVLSVGRPSQAGITLGIERAREEGAQFVHVGPPTSAVEGFPALSEPQFLARFGGPVDSLLALEDSYGENLRQLGHNRLPRGLGGDAPDLLESYVAAGLQFLIGRQVLRYGTRRSGERVPDGIALSGMTYVLFDTKAAADGFDFDAQTIRQFASYVQDFGRRYSNLGTPHAFLCVSGHFNDSDQALARRSQALYSEASTVLVTMNVEEVVRAVEYFRTNIHLRQFVDWNRLLAQPTLRSTEIEAAARAAERDGIATEID